LVVSGPVGVGKSSVAAEMFDQLADRGIPHAVIDLDALGICWPFGEADRFNERMTMRNLAAVWANYAEAGIGRVVIARVIESRAELTAFRTAIPGADIVVCQLVAGVAVLRERVARREAGSSYESLVRRSAELADSLRRSDAADFTVSTDGRGVPAVAVEVLTRAGWLSASGEQRFVE
jgi:hypothetical protein